MEFRHARPTDTAAVAHLHAQSWRHTYRGMLSDRYLDHEIFDDRLKLWQQRLSEPMAQDQLVLLADRHGQPDGFICIFLDADPRWGALLDNLHIIPERHGQGLGRRLMLAATDWVLRQRPQSGMYLWVFAENRQACRFYDRAGGVVGERQIHRIGDSDVPVCRYVWDDISDLI